MNCDIDAALPHRSCALLRDRCKEKNATNDSFMKARVPFHWSHVVMDKISTLNIPGVT